MNLHPTLRGRLLKALLQANKIDRARHSHDNFEDRAICSLNDGYTAAKYCQLTKNTIAKTESLQQWLRTRLDIQLLHAYVLQSKSIRRLELPNMAVKLLDREGAEEKKMLCLIISFTEDKTMSVSIVNYNSILWHKDPLLCLVILFTIYLFMRFEISQEQPPKLRN